MSYRSNQSQWRVTSTVDGHDMGAAMSSSGGGFDSDETKTRSAGTESQQAQGGGQTTGNLTLVYKYDPGQHDLNWLRSRRGWAEMSATRQKIQRTSTGGFTATGDPLPYLGILKAVTVVDYDANGTTVDTFSLELSTDGS